MILSRSAVPCCKDPHLRHLWCSSELTPWSRQDGATRQGVIGRCTWIVRIVTCYAIVRCFNHLPRGCVLEQGSSSRSRGSGKLYCPNFSVLPPARIDRPGRGGPPCPPCAPTLRARAGMKTLLNSVGGVTLTDLRMVCSRAAAGPWPESQKPSPNATRMRRARTNVRRTNERASATERFPTKAALRQE